MQVSPVNQQNFGTLYTGKMVADRLAKEGSNSEFAKELNSVRTLIRKNKLHKQENVDIILQTNGAEKDSFYGVISSKEQGVPMHPMYRCPVHKGIIDGFGNWVKAWNAAYKK